MQDAGLCGKQPRRSSGGTWLARFTTEALMTQKPDHVERGGEVRADTPDKWSEEDTARQEKGLPTSDSDENQPRADENQPKGHGPLKGTDTLATTDVAYIDREKGKRTTM